MSKVVSNKMKFLKSEPFNYIIQVGVSRLYNDDIITHLKYEITILSLSDTPGPCNYWAFMTFGKNVSISSYLSFKDGKRNIIGGVAHAET